MNHTPIPFKQFVEIVKPILASVGVQYIKSAHIIAQKIERESAIDTTISGELETTNVASPGDMLVQNKSSQQEAYVLTADEFDQRYEFVKKINNIQSEYKRRGYIYAIELTDEMLSTLGLPEKFEFIAPWGNAQLAKKGDYIACDEEFKTFYRIERNMFFETYEPA